MKEPDFVREVVGLAVQTGLPAEQVSALEHSLRREYGGRTVRIDRRAPLTVDDLNSALRESKSVRTIAKETGFSRATIYRMLSRKSHLSGE
jgi:DNA invertase Pin-like site-specific DNA recombinase